MTDSLVNGASDDAGDEVGGASVPPEIRQGPSSSAGISIAPVMHEALGDVWPKVKRMVRDAVRWSKFTRKLQTINDVEHRLYAGDYTLWLVFRDGEVIAAVLSSVTEETQCKVLDIAYGSGEGVEEWVGELYEIMDDLATELDCRFIRIEGREGWGPILKPLGFERAYSAFMIEV